MKKLYFSTFVPGLERPVEAMLRKEGGVAVERVLPGAALYRNVRTPAFSFVHQSFQVLFQMKPVASADEAVKRLLATGAFGTAVLLGQGREVGRIKYSARLGGSTGAQP